MKILLFFLTICSTVFSLTLEEKIGQMLMVHFHGEAINDDAKRLIDETHAGGFIFFNWSNGSLEKIQTLSRDLQRYSPLPLLLAIDQEGGRVQRLRKGFTALPPPCEMDQAYEWGCIVGQELTRAGINLNLAPVTEPYLKDRSHLDPQNFIDGMRAQGLLTCAKHYPGYGKDTVDAHFGLPIAKDLDSFEFCGADVVMTAHVLVPSVDPKFCATLSKHWIQKLRSNFNGVVITDSLTMKGVLHQAGSLKQAALLAAKAGCDILLLGINITDNPAEIITCEDLIEVHQFLVEAVKTKNLDEKLVDQAVNRIQKLKTTSTNPKKITS